VSSFADRALAAVAVTYLILAAGACAPLRPGAPAPAGTFIQEGLASWYGPGFHGRRTASGEIFNQSALTAAHPHLDFGTRVRVVNLANGRDVVVRINDRGPFVDGRIVDVSRAAAIRLDMVQAGVVRVQLFHLGNGAAGGAGD
jgi:rare lipoprotein A